MEPTWKLDWIEVLVIGDGDGVAVCNLRRYRGEEWTPRLHAYDDADWSATPLGASCAFLSAAQWGVAMLARMSAMLRGRNDTGAALPPLLPSLHPSLQMGGHSNHGSPRLTRGIENGKGFVFETEEVFQPGWRIVTPGDADVLLPLTLQAKDVLSTLQERLRRDSAMPAVLERRCA